MKKIMMLFFCFLLGGCVRMPAYMGEDAPSYFQKQAINVVEIQSFIVKGKTTKDQVSQKLGAPNIVTTNSEGEEVWTYMRGNIGMDYGNSYWTGIVAGSNWSKAQLTTNTMQIRITFDKNGIVKDYSAGQGTF